MPADHPQAQGIPPRRRRILADFIAGLVKLRSSLLFPLLVLVVSLATTGIIYYLLATQDDEDASR